MTDYTPQQVAQHEEYSRAEALLLRNPEFFSSLRPSLKNDETFWRRLLSNPPKKIWKFAEYRIEEGHELQTWRMHPHAVREAIRHDSSLLDRFKNSDHYRVFVDLFAEAPALNPETINTAFETDANHYDMFRHLLNAESPTLEWTVAAAAFLSDMAFEHFPEEAANIFSRAVRFRGFWHFTPAIEEDRILRYGVHASKDRYRVHASKEWCQRFIIEKVLPGIRNKDNILSIVKLAPDAIAHTPRFHTEDVVVPLLKDRPDLYEKLNRAYLDPTLLRWGVVHGRDMRSVFRQWEAATFFKFHYGGAHHTILKEMLHDLLVQKLPEELVLFVISFLASNCESYVLKPSMPAMVLVDGEWVRGTVYGHSIVLDYGGCVKRKEYDIWVSVGGCVQVKEYDIWVSEAHLITRPEPYLGSPRTSRDHTRN